MNLIQSSYLPRPYEYRNQYIYSDFLDFYLSLEHGRHCTRENTKGKSFYRGIFHFPRDLFRYIPIIRTVALFLSTMEKPV